MKDETKEILNHIKYFKENYKCPIDIEDIITSNELFKLYDYITNLQQIEQDHQKLNGELREELEDLRESNWAWHQTLKAQNKREYRSKFLKEFQQEYNTNTFPDTDLENTLKDKKNSTTIINIVFWIIWLIIIGLAIYGFVYMENDYLED